MKFDVLIAGGGMVGASLAGLLAQAGMQVAVVEAAAPPQAPPAAAFAARVSALTRASQRILEQLGAWQHAWQGRVQAYRHMRVWDQASAGEVEFDCADLGEPDLGHIVENQVIQLGLEQALGQIPGIRWFRPRTVTAVTFAADSVAVEVDGQTLHTRLLVGADGGQSRVRQLAGIGVRETPYDQHAVVAWVRAGDGHHETAWQHFLGSGPLAFLPLPGDNGSIVWSTSTSHARELLEMPVEAFDAALTTALDGRLGKLQCKGQRMGFPLLSRQADQYVQPRLALVGDAAHTIHPLAGQGVNLGLLDAASLAEVIGTALDAGSDPGKLKCLRHYERWRRGHNQLMDWSMTGFKQLFGSGAAPVRSLRGAGMQLLNRTGPVKRALIRQAMGLDGDLPRAAREFG